MQSSYSLLVNYAHCDVQVMATIIPTTTVGTCNAKIGQGRQVQTDVQTADYNVRLFGAGSHGHWRAGFHAGRSVCKASWLGVFV